MKKVLFVCTHNSARSQMAEGLLNHLYGNVFKAYSAGTHPTHVNPFAIAALKEIDIDISKNHSKSINDLKDNYFDYIITVCDNAKEECPLFNNGRNISHKSFEDLSSAQGTDEQKLAKFIEVRNQITTWIKDYFERKKF